MGLSEEVVRTISQVKTSHNGCLIRLKSLKAFENNANANMGADLSDIDFDAITYFKRASDKPARSWDDVPEKIKDTFEKIGIPEAERAYLAELLRNSSPKWFTIRGKKSWINLESSLQIQTRALKEYPELFKKYFAKTSTTNRQQMSGVKLSCMVRWNVHLMCQKAEM